MVKTRQVDFHLEKRKVFLRSEQVYRNIKSNVLNKIQVGDQLLDCFVILRLLEFDTCVQNVLVWQKLFFKKILCWSLTVLPEFYTVIYCLLLTHPRFSTQAG